MVVSGTPTFSFLTLYYHSTQSTNSTKTSSILHEHLVTSVIQLYRTSIEGLLHRTRRYDQPRQTSLDSGRPKSIKPEGCLGLASDIVSFY